MESFIALENRKINMLTQQGRKLRLGALALLVQDRVPHCHACLM